MGQSTLHAPDDTGAADLYRSVLWHLREAGIPYLVGGTYALEHHAGLIRDTKDLDLFVRRADWSRVEETLTPQGLHCELVYSHWLAKVRDERHFVDHIFSSGNGIVEVDDDWLRHGVPSVILEVPVHLVGIEEMIWSKSFVMERERYDGADVAHMIRQSGSVVDWVRLIRRFGPHAAVLLSHLVLFRFVYPAHQDTVPEWVMDELWHLVKTPEQLPARLCRGTLLSREQYLPDVTEWDYLDAREMPFGRMTPQQIREWTTAIADDK